MMNKQLDTSGLIVKTIIIDNNFKDGYRLQKLLQLTKISFNVISIDNKIKKAYDNIIYYKPEVIFTETELDGNTSFNLIKRINNTNLNPLIIFITKHPQYAIKALKHTAFDYILKPIDLDELKKTIDRLVNHLDINNCNKVTVPNHIIHKLSDRELEITKLLFLGKSSKEIAVNLGISKATVDTHRRNILEKTGYKNTAELICNQ